MEKAVPAAAAFMAGIPGPQPPLAAFCLVWFTILCMGLCKGVTPSVKMHHDPLPAGKPRTTCGSSQLLSHLMGRWVAAGVATAMAAAWGASYPIFMHAALVCGMVVVVGSVMDVTALTCHALYDLAIAPHFDAPFKSTSLAGEYAGCVCKITALDGMRVSGWYCEEQWAFSRCMTT